MLNNTINNTMKKTITFIFTVSFFFTVFAQRTEIIPATKADSAFFQMDKDGRIYMDGFKATLSSNQMKGLKDACIQEVKNFNVYLAELWKTWDEARDSSGAYSSEIDFYKRKLKIKSMALGQIIFDGESGIEQVLNLYKVFLDKKNNLYYRYVKSSKDDTEVKIFANHVGYINGEYRDSVYEDSTIRPAKIWVTNKYNSLQSAPTIKRHIKNIQDAARRSGYGYVKFNGGEYRFSNQLQWDEKTKKYVGAIDYYQEFQRITPDGHEKYSDRVHRRVIIYVIPTVTIVDGKAYVGWAIKFGNIKALETTPLK